MLRHRWTRTSYKALGHGVAQGQKGRLRLGPKTHAAASVHQEGLHRGIAAQKFVMQVGPA